jgi:hypothetical protein
MGVLRGGASQGPPDDTTGRAARPVPALKRCKVISVLFSLQALILAWYLTTGLAVVVFSGTDIDTKKVLLQEGAQEAIGIAGSVALGVLAWRGSPSGLYAAVVVSALSLVVDFWFAVLESLWMGPYAILFLLFPMPSLALTAAVAWPILVLSLTVLARNRLGSAPAI